MTKKHQTIDVPSSSYQPSKEELQKDLRMPGTFKDAIKAIVKPVKVRSVMPRKKAE